MTALPITLNIYDKQEVDMTSVLKLLFQIKSLCESDTGPTQLHITSLQDFVSVPPSSRSSINESLSGTHCSTTRQHDVTSSLI